MIDADGRPTLPWIAGPLRELLGQARGHALLLQCPPGSGAFDLALALAQSWLCEAPAAGGVACGRCVACHAVQGRVHADLLVLQPEVLRRATGWPFGDDRPEGDERAEKKKPSRQIRIDEVRAAIDWVGRTSARGRGKVWLLHPVEALNEHSASALLKTAEEPPAGTRLVLTCTDPQAILPTVRSRCQRVRVPEPGPAEALGWLEEQGVARPAVLLAAASGRPLEALELARAGIDAAAWEALPAAVAQGRAGALAGWPVPRALDALAKLGLDALARHAGSGPRWFPAGAVPAPASLDALRRWLDELAWIARHAEHPWHEGLMGDALAARARLAFVSPRVSADASSSPSRHRAGAAERGFDTLGT